MRRLEPIRKIQRDFSQSFTFNSVEKCTRETKLQTYQRRILSYLILTPHPVVAIAVRIVNRDSGNQVVVFTSYQALIDLHRQRSVIAITQFNQIEISFLNRGVVGSFS